MCFLPVLTSYLYRILPFGCDSQICMQPRIDPVSSTPNLFQRSEQAGAVQGY